MWWQWTTYRLITERTCLAFQTTTNRITARRSQWHKIKPRCYLIIISFWCGIIPSTCRVASLRSRPDVARHSSFVLMQSFKRFNGGSPTTDRLLTKKPICRTSRYSAWCSRPHPVALRCHGGPLAPVADDPQHRRRSKAEARRRAGVTESVTDCQRKRVKTKLIGRLMTSGELTAPLIYECIFLVGVVIGAACASMTDSWGTESRKVVTTSSHCERHGTSMSGYGIRRRLIGHSTISAVRQATHDRRYGEGAG